MVPILTPGFPEQAGVVDCSPVVIGHSPGWKVMKLEVLISSICVNFTKLSHDS